MRENATIDVRSSYADYIGAFMSKSFDFYSFDGGVYRKKLKDILDDSFCLPMQYSRIETFYKIL